MTHLLVNNIWYWEFLYLTIEVSGNLWPTAFCSICISGLNNSHCVAEDQTCKIILHVAKIITYWIGINCDCLLHTDFLLISYHLETKNLAKRSITLVKLSKIVIVKLDLYIHNIHLHTTLNSHCVAEDQTCKIILHVAKIITYWIGINCDCLFEI
jgi:hypothetical protein